MQKHACILIEREEDKEPLSLLSHSSAAIASYALLEGLEPRVQNNQLFSSSRRPNSFATADVRDLPVIHLCLS